MKKMYKRFIFIVFLAFACIFQLNTKVNAAEKVEVENETEFITAMNNSDVDEITVNSAITVSKDINVVIDGNDKTLNLNGNYLKIDGNHKFIVKYNTSNKFILDDTEGQGLIVVTDIEEINRAIFTPENNTNESVEMIIDYARIETNALWIFEDCEGFNLKINKGNFCSLCSLFNFNTKYNSSIVLNRFGLRSILNDSDEGLRIAYTGKYAQDNISTIMGKNLKLTYINCEGESIDVGNNIKCGEIFRNDGTLYMKPAKGLVINDITFETKEYGYAKKELKQKNIIINNTSDKAIKITDVILYNNDDKFSLNNLDNLDNQEFEIPSILPENTYQNFVIKPKIGLLPGKHSVIIIAMTEDGDDYRAKATFEVTKAHLKLSINLPNWTYGDEPNKPSSNGNLGEAEETYEYAKKIEGVSNEDLDFKNQVPNQPGKYVVRLEVEKTDLYYAGSATKEFEITRKQIEPQVNIEQTNFVYSGNKIEPKVEVKYTDKEDTKILEKDIDYSVEYGENINAGLGKIIIKSLDTSNYIFDEITENITITPKQILSENVSTPEFITYTGNALEPDVIVVDEDKELIKDIDYEVTYKGSDGNAGEKIIATVTGKANYGGSIEKTVNITTKKKQVLNFDKKEITKLFNDSKFVLTPNHTEGDGEISYISSNTDIVEVDNNTGEVKIVGIGNAKITATAKETQDYLPEKTSYTIIVNKADYDMSKVKFENLVVVYDKNIHSIMAENLPEGVTVKYTNNDKIEPGEYKVTASFIGDTEHYNPIENKEAILKIIKTNYNMNSVIFDNLTVTYDGKEHNIFVKGLPDGVLVSYNNNRKTNVGTYNISANFTGDVAHYNLLPSKTATLTIKPRNIANANIAGIKDKTYTGKKITQTLVIKDGKNILKEGRDYTVKYKFNKYVGKASVSITGKGNYTGTVIKKFYINPKGTKLTKLIAGKKQFKVTWKKQKNETSGYEIQNSTDKKFKSGNKKVKINKNKTTSNMIRKLKAKKNYYVRIRTYKVVDGKKFYSEWSKVLKVKIKK